MCALFFCSEFAFDPSKWSREQMDEDFGKIAKTFNALKSVVRVPDIDQKYKIAVFASKQVSLPYIYVHICFIRF